jgi:hypothetical protein
VPSDAERFLPWPLGFTDAVRNGWYVILVGEVGRESLSTFGEESCTLCCSQNSSRELVFVVSVMRSLRKVSDVSQSLGQV